MNYNPWPATPYHNPVELEHRITSTQAEVRHLSERQEDHEEETSEAIDGLKKRVTLLERGLTALLYVSGAIVAGKTGDVAEFVLTILKARS